MIPNDIKKYLKDSKPKSYEFRNEKFIAPKTLTSKTLMLKTRLLLDGVDSEMVMFGGRRLIKERQSLGSAMECVSTKNMIQQLEGNENIFRYIY